MSPQEAATKQSREYISNALMRAVMLLEGASAQHEPGYHNFWLQVDAECLRIIAGHMKGTPHAYFD